MPTRRPPQQKMLELLTGFWVSQMLYTVAKFGVVDELGSKALAAGPGGMERTKAEFAALFVRAGLRLAKVYKTASPLSILEAVPV